MKRAGDGDYDSIEDDCGSAVGTLGGRSTESNAFLEPSEVREGPDFISTGQVNGM